MFDFEQMMDDRKRQKSMSDGLAEMLEQAFIEDGPPAMKAAFTLGREIRLFCKDLKRLMLYIDRPEEEAVQIYTDALEYVRLAHEGLRSFMKAHVEKYGEGVIDEPV